jgi:undecaprenyl-diphosphatase
LVGRPRELMPLALALAALAALWGAMLWLGGTGADRTILDALYAGGAPLRYELAGAVTHLGTYPTVVAFALLGLVALLGRGESRRALLLSLLVTTGPLFVELQKTWFGRLRPHDQEHLVVVQSYAFPSGHSANAMLIWLGLALLAVEGPRVRPLAIAGALLIAFLVGLSRIVLGVHWPSDVVGGWALALFWLLLLSHLLGVPLTRAGTPARLAHSPSKGE